MDNTLCRAIKTGDKLPVELTTTKMYCCMQHDAFVYMYSDDTVACLLMEVADTFVKKLNVKCQDGSIAL